VPGKDDSDSTSRRKTSLSLSPAAAKALARAKFELFNRFDLVASQSEILEVLLMAHTRDVGVLREALEARRQERAS
jgi:hypothetical protein